jgi:hypothetical protein
MANENTHLYIASIIRKRLPKKQQGIIDKNPNLYYIGSIAPDIFLASARYRKFSKILHKKGVVKDLLKNAQKSELPFVYGYITHIKTDEIIHKVIPKDSYNHMYIEVSIDKYLGLKKPAKELISPEIPKVLARIAGFPAGKLLGFMKRQTRLNNIFTKSRFIHYLMPRVLKSVFYSHVKKLIVPKDIDKLLKKAVENSVNEIKKCSLN